MSIVAERVRRFFRAADGRVRLKFGRRARLKKERLDHSA
jgi:hypothetical protein